MKTPITKLFLAGITIFASLVISCTTQTQQQAESDYTRK